MTGDTMTLAFELDALGALDDPGAAFADAHRWSTYVGVVSDRLAYQVVNRLRDHDIYDEDFFSRADKLRSLEQVADRARTDRHVFIGETDEDERLAEAAGWEYLRVERAAEKAGWGLTTDEAEH